MGAGGKLKRLLRRKLATPPPPPPSEVPASVSGLLPSSGSHPPGPALLRHFLFSLSPRGAHAAHTRALVRPASEWRYHFRQGRDVAGLEALRAQLNGRLTRCAARFQAGGWTRLMLGSDYTATPARKQTHLLTFVLPYCPCLACRVQAASADLGMHDMDEMLEDAERGEGFGEQEVQKEPQEEEGDPLHRVRKRARYDKLPDRAALGVLGDILDSHEFELGTVSKISAKSAKVNFAPFAKQFFGSGNEYCGQLSMAEVASTVAEKAKEYYKKHKGKTERRFYVHGTLNRLLLDGTCVALFPMPSQAVQTEPVSPIGVLFRKQVMSVITGKLALEDSFGAFIHTDTPFYIGFGQDCEGSQTIFSDGTVGRARHLGINELRTHLDFSSGNEIEINIR